MPPSLLHLVLLFWSWPWPWLGVLVGPAASHRLLPRELRECYSEEADRGGLFAPQLPLDLRTILDVLRKVERQAYYATNVRTLSAALIKRFKLDGIVYSEKLPARRGVLRYAATGPQRARNRIVQELVPSPGGAGNGGSLVEEVVRASLTRQERCLLHFALSSTIWDRFDPGTEEALCRPPPTEKWQASHAGSSDAESSSGSLHPYRSVIPTSNGTGNGNANDDFKCPKEAGVVYTEYGTVALGSILAAVAAGLEPQLVEAKRLMSMPPDDDDDDDGGDADHRPSTLAAPVAPSAGAIPDAKVDNVWMATVSGELAEMVISQGPIYEGRMFLGASGFWDDTNRPRAFYVKHPQNNFDFTRAEVIGAVDGLIIGKKLQEWTRVHKELRLSQVLDMYFSESGIAGVRACKRAEEFPPLAPQGLLEEQTYAAAQVLGHLKSVASMTDQGLQRLVGQAVQHFGRYTDQRLFPAVLCRADLEESPSPAARRLEVAFAFDGSWTRGYTADFFAVLVNDLDVSMYGSKMGVVNGESGRWVQTPTSSPADVHRAIDTFKDIPWPAKMNFRAVFDSVSEYLDSAWASRRDSSSSGHYGQAVVLLATNVQINEDDIKLALEALKTIKAKHPDVYFLYYTLQSDAKILNPLLLSDQDRIVTSLRIDDIRKSLSTVPVTLRPTACKANTQLEDYLNPSESITYRLHSHWRTKTRLANVTFQGVGYGKAQVCSWSQWTSIGDKSQTRCQALPNYGDITFTSLDESCDKDDSCPSIYFQVFNATTNMKCTEIDCKTPDQVRFMVRIEGFDCSSSSDKTLVNFILITVCLGLVTFRNMF